MLAPSGHATSVRLGSAGPWTYALYSTDDTLAIDSFAADNTEIESGDTVTLTWAMRNATSASINQGVGPLSSSQLESGSTTVNPTATTTYTLTASDGTDTVTASVTVTVEEPVPPVTIDSFTADDTTIESGESTVLRWQTSNATSVRLEWVAGERGRFYDDCVADRRRLLTRWRLLGRAGR